MKNIMLSAITSIAKNLSPVLSLLRQRESVRATLSRVLILLMLAQPMLLQAAPFLHAAEATAQRGVAKLRSLMPKTSEMKATETTKPALEKAIGIDEWMAQSESKPIPTANRTTINSANSETLMPIPDLKNFTSPFKIFPTMAMFQSGTSLEMGATGPAGTGPSTTAQAVTLFENAVTAYAPTTTVTYTLSNQQFGPGTVQGVATNSAINFGGSGNSTADSPVGGFNLYSLMNGISGSTNAMYTACVTCAAGTSIDVATDRAISFNVITDAFINAANTNLQALNARVYVGDVTISFNRPVSNPVLQFTGMGGQGSFTNSQTVGAVTTTKSYDLGYAAEFDLVGSGVTLSKLNGNSVLNVTSNSITNTATRIGASSVGAVINGITRTAASGSVLATGTNITSITMKMYIRGDGGVIQSTTQFPVTASATWIPATADAPYEPKWAIAASYLNTPTTTHAGSVAGDTFLMGASIQKPVTVSGTVFNDTNGLSDSIINGTGTNAGGVNAILVDAAGDVVASVAVPSTGIYSFTGIGEGNYTVRLSTTAGVQDTPAPAINLPATWFSRGEGTVAAGDGTADGNTTITVAPGVDRTGLNFGIAQPSLSLAKTNPVSFAVGTAANYTLTVSNAANRPTSGTSVVVNEKLPPNIAYNSAAASTGATGASCTSSGTLAAGLDLICTITTAAGITGGGSAAFTLNVTPQTAAGAVAGINKASVDPAGGIPVAPGTCTATGTPAGCALAPSITPVLAPTVAAYKSVKLTTDADSSGTITAGDTLTWTVQYVNTGSGSATNFQINDALPSGLTITTTGVQTVTVSGSGTSATKNTSYTGAAVGAVSDLLAASATLAAGGVITVTIPVTVNAGATGTKSNQASATGTGLSAAVLTDNAGVTADLPATVTAAPYSLTIPASSVIQTIAATVDPTTVTIAIATPTVVAYKSVKRTVDADANSVNSLGDTMVYTINYVNTGSVAVPAFQINDVLPAGLTITSAGAQSVTVTGSGTTAAVNSAYTGAAAGAVSNLLAASASLNAGGVITVTIPVTITTSLLTVRSNQASGTGTGLSVAVLTDNAGATADLPATVTAAPYNLTVPGSSINQTILVTTDPTTFLVGLPTIPPVTPGTPGATSTCSTQVTLNAKVFLGGAYDTATGLMRDSLRTANLIPLNEPYLGLGFSHGLGGGGEVTTSGVLAVSGNNAIVDWVLLELRDTLNNVVATRSALVQRDGDVVSAADGVSAVSFAAPTGNYYISVRHRNHLDVMTDAKVTFGASAATVDFTSAALGIYNSSLVFDGVERKIISGAIMGLWPGDANNDEQIDFSAAFGGDVWRIQAQVYADAGNSLALANYISSGYHLSDLDLKGSTIFQGPNNDVDVIFFSVLLHPNNGGGATTFVIPGQMPASTTFTTASLCSVAIAAFKSVKLTTDADSSGTITAGDTLTWTLQYANTGTVDVPAFQIADQLPSGITITAAGAQTVTVTGAGTSATKDATYTGASIATSMSLTAGATLAQQGTITLTIPVTVNAGFTGTLSNQASGSGTGMPTAVSTDNAGVTADLPATVTAAPYNLTVPGSSVAQTITAAVDATTATVIGTTLSLGGKVFEDINYGGGAGRDFVSAPGTARPGVRVELYDAAGAYLGFTFTNATGDYTFTGLSAANYTVRVVDAHVTSSRTGGCTPSADGISLPACTQFAVQTFRTNGLTSNVGTADPNRVGGETPNLIDAGANTTNATLASLTTATNTPQSITPVIVGSSNITGIDFGFNFDTIVSTRDSGQGSLRQFITNSNALNNSSLAQVGQTAGKEVSIFMIADGNSHPGLRSGIASGINGTGGNTNAAVISLLTNFSITDANTSLDASTQTTNVGDLNAGTVGTGGIVGTDGLSLSTIPRPEIVLNLQAVPTNTNAILVSGASTTLNGFASYGYRTTNNLATLLKAAIVIQAGVTNAGAATVTQLLGGTMADGSDPGVTASTVGYTLQTAGAANISNNYLAYNSDAITFENTNGTSVNFINNEVAHNGPKDNNGSNASGIYADQMETIEGTKNITIRGNLVRNSSKPGYASSQGQGIQISYSSFITLENNTWTDNNVYAINASSSDTLIQKNIITGTKNTGLGQGSGIAVYYGGPLNTGLRNHITQNSIYQNAKLGIDFQVDGVTPNNGTVGATQPNNGMDYPIFTSVDLSATSLTVKGFVGINGITGNTTFGSSKIELFKADNSPANQDGAVLLGDGLTKPHGEGRTYLGFCTADSNGLINCTITANGLVAGDAVTATATDSVGNTSEFNANFTVNYDSVLANKSVKLTTDADSSGSVTPGDTLTYTINYVNTGIVNISNFQMNDPLPSGLTITGAGDQTVTVTGAGTAATKNSAYTGAAAGAVSNLLAASAALKVGGVITVTIPVTVDAGATGTKANQATGTGTELLTAGVLTDNAGVTADLPAMVTAAPYNLTVPASSVAQTIAATIDPTNVTIATTPTVLAFKSVKLTTDVNSNSLPDPGDTLIWSVWYKNTGTIDATTFQINDVLPVGVTITGAGNQTVTVTGTTTATKNTSYTGAATGAVSEFLSATTTFVAGDLIQIDIPATINAGFAGSLINQAIGTGGNLPPAGVFTDNADNVTPGLPSGVTIPTGSAVQTLTPATDPTSLTVAGVPLMTLVKTVTPIGDQQPGTDLTYQIVFTNTGNATAQEVVIFDPIPNDTDFKLGSATMTLGTTGLTMIAEYSNDFVAATPATATWTHTPVTAGGGADTGYDRNVKAVRWRVSAGTLSQTPPNHTGEVGFIVKIR